MDNNTLNTLRSVNEALCNSGHYLNFTALLSITEKLMENFTYKGDMNPATHDGRVNIALDTEVIMNYVAEDKKINAIKELRSATLCSLKEAKDAIEDARVWGTHSKSARDLQALRDKLSSNY